MLHLISVDESFTEHNELKKGAPDIDVFAIVNRLRKDRAKMIEDFSTYKLLFYCIGNYGKNRVAYHQEVSKMGVRNLNEQIEDEATRAATASAHGLYQNEPGDNNNSVGEEIEYVMHNSDEEDKYSIFDEYVT